LTNGSGSQERESCWKHRRNIFTNQDGSRAELGTIARSWPVGGSLTEWRAGQGWRVHRAIPGASLQRGRLLRHEQETYGLGIDCAAVFLTACDLSESKIDAHGTRYVSFQGLQVCRLPSGRPLTLARPWGTDNGIERGIGR
jgi:hypothetical protein